MRENNLYSKYVSTHYQFVAAATKEGLRKRYYLWKSSLSHLLPADKNISILEIGAGVGHNLEALRKLGYKNVIGTDYSRECVDFCRKRGLKLSLVSPQTEQQFYHKYQKKFDLVLLYDVLEHYLPNEGINLLLQARALLKPNGFLLILLPNASHPLSNSLFFADITHKFIYNETSLSQLLRLSGFSQMKFIQINSYTLVDDNFVKQMAKKTVIALVAFLGELFWRTLALSQGILLRECKPTLVAIARR